MIDTQSRDESGLPHLLYVSRIDTQSRDESGLPHLL